MHSARFLLVSFDSPPSFDMSELSAVGTRGWACPQPYQCLIFLIFFWKTLTRCSQVRLYDFDRITIFSGSVRRRHGEGLWLTESNLY
jgi:hypothetical protein